MKKIFVFTFTVFLVLATVGCGFQKQSTHPNADDIHFIQVEEYSTAGRLLVDPVIVSKTGFLKEYDSNLAFLPENANFRLDYPIDAETLEIIEDSKPTNGVITCYDRESQKGYFIYLAKGENYVTELYAISSKDTITSKIDSHEVKLYNLKNPRDPDEILHYAEFAVGEIYYSVEVKNWSEADTVKLIQEIIESNA